MAKKPAKKKEVKRKAARKPKAGKVLVKKSKPATKTKGPVAKTKKKPVVSKLVVGTTAKVTKKKTVAKPGSRPIAAKKTISRVKAAKPAVQKTSPQKTALSSSDVTPVAGVLPPPIISKPVESPIGTIKHYYSDLGVAVVQLNQNTLRVGDPIHIKGHTTDFKQTVQSMEVDHKPVFQVKAADIFGLKVIDHAREHDLIYKVNHR